MPRILVIDDEELVRVSVALVLRSQGWEVVQAKDGLEGLTLARRLPPDLIVCDLNMPVMDGFETMEAVCCDPDLAHVPCVAITGQPGNNYERRALEAGARQVLLKPFTNDELIQLVEAYLPAPAPHVPPASLSCRPPSAPPPA